MSLHEGDETENVWFRFAFTIGGGGDIFIPFPTVSLSLPASEMIATRTRKT